MEVGEGGGPPLAVDVVCHGHGVWGGVGTGGAPGDGRCDYVKRFCEPENEGSLFRPSKKNDIDVIHSPSLLCGGLGGDRTRSPCYLC